MASMRASEYSEEALSKEEPAPSTPAACPLVLGAAAAWELCAEAARTLGFGGGEQG